MGDGFINRIHSIPSPIIVVCVIISSSYFSVNAYYYPFTVFRQPVFNFYPHKLYFLFQLSIATSSGTSIAT